MAEHSIIEYYGAQIKESCGYCHQAATSHSHCTSAVNRRSQVADKVTHLSPPPPFSHVGALPICRRLPGPDRSRLAPIGQALLQADDVGHLLSVLHDSLSGAHLQADQVTEEGYQAGESDADGRQTRREGCGEAEGTE